MATHIQTRKAIETMRIRMTGLGRMRATWYGAELGGGVVADDGLTQKTVVALAERFSYA